MDLPEYNPDDNLRDVLQDDIGKMEKNDTAIFTFANVNLNAKESEITPQEREFLVRIMQICAYQRSHMTHRGKKYRGLYDSFNVTTQILSTLVGSTGLGFLFNVDTSSGEFWLIFVISAISLLSGITGTITSTLDFEKKANQCHEWNSGYSELVTKIGDFLTTPQTNRKDVEIFKNSVVIEFNKLHGEAVA